MHKYPHTDCHSSCQGSNNNFLTCLNNKLCYFL